MKNIIPRNMSGLRELLFQELEAIKEGDTAPAKTSGISKISSQILTSVRLELENKRFAYDKELPPLELVIKSNEK